MFFASDNAGPALPEVLAAISETNTGYAMPYGDDPLSVEVCGMIRKVFEAPEAAVYLVPTGTAANALALATLTQPYETVFCSPVAHIHEDECNAPEFYTGGAKLTLVGQDDKMSASELRDTILREETRGVHGPQRGAVSITQVTERGGVYTLDELRALTSTAKEFGLPVHLDGARFSNAAVALGCSAAEMSWKLGVDAVSFGGTKNGCLGVEAVIFFDPAKAWEFELRRKRGAHLFSKHRYLAAQMKGYLKGGLWLEAAAKANAACTHLAEGLGKLDGAEITHAAEANIIFARMTRALHQRLHDAGAVYYVMGGDVAKGDASEMLDCRLVCDWSVGLSGVDAFLAAAQG